MHSSSWVRPRGVAHAKLSWVIAFASSSAWMGTRALEPATSEAIVVAPRAQEPEASRGGGGGGSGPGLAALQVRVPSRPGPPEPPGACRGDGGAGLGPCAGGRDLCTRSRAAVVGTSYTFGVSICSSCSARARCFLASTRLPTRKYVCPTCRACAAACEHAPTPSSPSESKAEGGRLEGAQWEVTRARLAASERRGCGDAPAAVRPRCQAGRC